MIRIRPPRLQPIPTAYRGTPHWVAGFFAFVPAAMGWSFSARTRCRNTSLGRAFLPPGQPDGDGQLKKHSSNRIDKYITQAWTARRHKELVKLIQSARGSGQQHRQHAPAESPARQRGKRGAPGKECQRPKESIAAEMRGLSDKKVDLLEAMR